MWPRSSEGGTSPIRRMPAFTGAPLAGLAQETATCRAFPGVPAGQGGGCAFSGRLPKRIPKGKCETCSLRMSGVDCISRGQALIRHGFGIRVSLAITINRRFNVGARSFSGNSCGGGARTGAGRHPVRRRPDVAVVSACIDNIRDILAHLMAFLHLIAAAIGTTGSIKTSYRPPETMAQNQLRRTNEAVVRRGKRSVRYSVCNSRSACRPPEGVTHTK